ncbi:MAG: hypothetical protein ACLR8Y_15495 [Alistipes indistinctus]
MISELGGMYTDIANLQNQLDGTASEGKGSNFIQKLFGDRHIYEERKSRMEG